MAKVVKLKDRGANPILPLTRSTLVEMNNGDSVQMAYDGINLTHYTKDEINDAGYITYQALGSYITYSYLETKLNTFDKISELTDYDGSYEIAVGDTHDEAISKLIKIIDDNEYVVAGALSELRDDMKSYVSANDLNAASYVTRNEIISAGYLTTHQSLSSYATSANYDSNTKKIYLKHNNTVLSEIDATDFIKDGMVDTAYVDGSYLTISFNTDAGKEPVNIEISDIFDPTNYYDKPTVDEKVESLMQNQKLSFYTTGTCSVNVYAKDDSLNGDYSQQTPTSTFEYSANTLVSLNIADNEYFEISNPNDCINIIYSWPGVCEKFYDWFMSVDMFCNMIFNFNKMDHSAWEHSTTDGTKYKFGVVEAQYRNCVFWWDVAMTNANVHCYTLHKTQECPLFYSTIPENTYKTLCEPYNITNNPNFTNKMFINSMALSSCRSALAYSHTRSVPFGCWQDSSVVTNIIKINGDCSTFMGWSGAEDTAIFDCETVTNFGYKLSGDYMYLNGFYRCRNLKNLMLKNLKVSVNLSWSPISQYSLDYIISNAANTSAITIALSPYTWYNLTDSIKTTAESKNINLILDKSHYSDMQDMKIWDDVEGIKNSYLSADNLDLTSYVSKTELNDAGYITSFTETDPTVPSYVKSITEQNITNWNTSHTNSHTHSNKTVIDGIKTTDISNWNSKTDNLGTITGITMNGTSKGTSGVVDLGTVITSHQSLENYVTKSDLNSASYIQSFTETDPTVPTHVKSITQQNITDWNNKLSSETQLSKGTTSGSGNAVTDISVSNHQITLTKGATFLTEHQSLANYVTYDYIGSLDDLTTAELNTIFS